MEKVITLCDLCQRPVKGPGNKPIRPVHGITLELGQSLGGWGRREDLLTWSGEVCEICYGEFRMMHSALELWLRKRDGTRAPTIIVSENGVTVETPRTFVPPDAYLPAPQPKP